MSTESDAIIMNDIVKTFGHVRALDGLNLSVLTGEVHGFLGPNGAGKSTAIRVLLGQLHADSGTAQVLGGDPWLGAAVVSAVVSVAAFAAWLLLPAIPAWPAALDPVWAGLAGVAVLGWGQFVTVLINFLILAFIIFLLVRYANRIMKRGEETPAGPTEAELLTEIRDELRRR